MLQEEADVILYKLLPIYWFHLPCFLRIVFIYCFYGPDGFYSV